MVSLVVACGGTVVRDEIGVDCRVVLLFLAGLHKLKQNVSQPKKTLNHLPKPPT